MGNHLNINLFTIIMFAVFLPIITSLHHPNSITPTTLSSDFRITLNSSGENTLKTISQFQDNDCPKGQIVLVTGDRPGKIIRRDLYNSNGTINTSWTSESVDFPYNECGEAVSTDNQIIRLKSGGLMAMKLGYSWEPLPNPPNYSNCNVTLEISDAPFPDKYEFRTNRWGIDRGGARGSILFWKSFDCGKTWKMSKKIDAALVGDGKYGLPRRANSEKYPDEGDKWYASGFDRPEIYQDPWTGRIYLATTGTWGTYPNEPTDPKKTFSQNELIFYSDNEGDDWQTMAILPSGPIMVMTSTPNKRFYAFRSEGEIPTLYYTLDINNPKSLSKGFHVFYDGDSNCKVGHDTRAKAYGDNGMNQLSISRVSIDNTSSEVRVAYSGVTLFGWQVFYIEHVRVDDLHPEEQPTTTPLTILEPEDPWKSSISYGTFIDPDYVQFPSGLMSNKSVFYWVESSRKGEPVILCAKYILLYNSFLKTQPQFLSKYRGDPRHWTSNLSIPDNNPNNIPELTCDGGTLRPLGSVGNGDYLTGGFFLESKHSPFKGPSKTKLRYLCQWNEPCGIRGNIVTVEVD